MKIFPGKYIKKSNPSIIVTVSAVTNGTVFLHGVSSPVKSMMDSMTFMREYKKL